MIYINGVLATAEDLNRLEKDLKQGKARAFAGISKSGIFYTVYGG